VDEVPGPPCFRSTPAARFRTSPSWPRAWWARAAVPPAAGSPVDSNAARHTVAASS
jgi:hypothetical protein